jgi:hypothetical protein
MTAVGLPALLEELKPDAMPAHAATVGEATVNELMAELAKLRK